METRCVRARIKPGSIEAVREWARTINARRVEALATLVDEQIQLESVFLESAADGQYLIYYTRGADLSQADKVTKTSQHPIDAYHYEFMRQHTEKGVPLELLVDLEA
ncbi:MAG: hypothetical protein IPI67_20955 [Myxococcales bacterium]|nr:hypothetical protein [Myxococcales bacterium]